MTESSANVETVGTAVGIGALAFGVAGVLAPRALTRCYGVRDESDNFAFVMRMWGTRTAALGALMVTARPGADRRRVLVAGTALNAVDAVLALVSPGTSARTRILTAITSGGFAALGASALAGGGE